MEEWPMKDEVRQIEDWLEAKVERYGASSLFLPAGETPRTLYKQWRLRPHRHLRNLSLLQVDDVLDGNSKGMFARFFQEELPDFNVHPPKEGTSAHLAILGLGTNGHLAFHEPHLPRDFTFGEVDLEEDTLRRLRLEPGTRGITYGIGAFLQCRAILLVVKGSSKRAAYEAFLSKSDSSPAASLWGHSDLTILTDLEGITRGRLEMGAI
jgi:6-phosphogluconolactonase/glucosamine-6-phosphate isomerase/deaminase